MTFLKNFIHSYRILIFVTLFIVLLKIIISFGFPVIQDEYNILLWGKYISWGGYYDHPPLSGWVVAFMQLFNHSIYWVRMFSILVVPMMAWICFLYFKRTIPLKANAVFYFFMLSPLNFMTFLITPDTTLILVSFLSFFTFYLAEHHPKKQYPLTIASGIFLGLALFTKYTATTLAMAYFIYIGYQILFNAKKRNIYIVKLLILITLSFVILFVNLLWNYMHGWPNILFNLLERNQDALYQSITTRLKSIVLFVLGIILYLSPLVLFYLIKYRVWKNVSHSFLSTILFTQILFYMIILSYRPVDMHWLLAIFTIYPMLLAIVIPAPLIKKFITGFGIVFYTVVGLFIPLAFFLIHTNILYSPTFTMATTTKVSIALHHEPKDLLNRIHTLQQTSSFNIAAYSNNYGFAAELSYLTGNKVGLFKVGTMHGRTYDRLFNYKNTNHGTLLLIARKKMNNNSIRWVSQFFKSIEIIPMHIHALPYTIILGKNFNYTLYRDKVLKNIDTKYYTVPAWLPYTHTFMSKYGFS